MRGLYLRVFALFWLAQSLIFVISTTQIVRQRFPAPNTVADALDSNLQHDAALALQAFEAGGCPAFAANGTRHEPAGAMLLAHSGEPVCQTAPALSVAGLVPHFPNRVDGREVGGRYLWLVPVVSRNGTAYEYVWFQPPRIRPERRWNLLHYAFPQLPVAIAIGGLTAFLMVLMFSRPLVRLRRAARALAEGQLSVRVEEPPAGPFASQSNEFQGLVHDFNHMAERLQSLVSAQRLLLRDVSHELRSPLSRLSVALELAREDAGPALEPHLARIERESHKLNDLIGQLLTLSAMESPEGLSGYETLSLNRLCEQLLPDSTYEAARRPCTVRLQQDSECLVHGNWQLLHRALENVVRNAIRYTRPGTEVVIRIAASDFGPQPMSLVEVTDSGPGIPPAELEHIFRPFHRVDPARSSATGGFGVGLSITERAVQLHGGTIQASNRPEGGTRILMSFPPAPTDEHRPDP